MAKSKKTFKRLIWTPPYFYNTFYENEKNRKTMKGGREGETGLGYNLNLEDSQLQHSPSKVLPKQIAL